MKARFVIALLAASMLCASAMAQDTAKDWYKKGIDLKGNGSYEESVEAYDRAIDLESNNATFYIAKVPSLIALATIVNNQSKRNESLEAVNKALQIDSKNPSAWELKGEVFSQMKRYNESLEAYDKAIENIGSYRQDGHLNQTEFLSYIWTSKSISLWQLTRYNESLEAVDKAVQVDPAGNYDAWAFKGELLASLGRYNESLLAFEGAAATETASSQPEIKALPWADEGYVLIHMGRYEEADGIYQEIIRLNLTGEGADRRLADAWRSRGDALASLEKYNESLQAFDRAIELNSEKAPYAWTGKGDALLASDRYDEAIISYDQALKLYPEFADAGIAHAQKGKGDSLTKLGKREEALAAYGAAVVASDKAIMAFNNATTLDKAISFTFDPYPLDKEFWYNRGSALETLGRQSEANSAFAKSKEPGTFTVTVAQENTADGWYKKSQELQRNGSYDEAVKALDRALETAPSNATMWDVRGYMLLNMADGNESLKSFDKVIELNPNDADAWRGKGSAFFSLHRYEEAVNAYDNALKIDPSNIGASQGKGIALAEMGKQNESAKAFANSLEILDRTIQTANSTQNLSQAWLEKGFALQEQGKYEESVKALDNATNADPKNEMAWKIKGVLLSRELKRHNDAVKAFDKALQINPKDPRTWQSKGDALKVLGRNSEADTAFAKAKDLGALTVTATQENTTDYWTKKGNNLVGNGSFEEALQDYDQAILIDAQNAEAWRGKGNAQSILGQRDEGNQSFEKSLTLYDEIIKANPEDMNAQFNKSMVLTALGRPKEALNVLDNIIELDPKNYSALGRKAEVLRIIGMYNESINTFDKALQMIPASATETLFSFWMSKGWTQQAHGDDEAALTAFEKGITLNPEDGSAWFFKGDALKALGRQSEAEAAFAKAKELGYQV